MRTFVSEFTKHLFSGEGVTGGEGGFGLRLNAESSKTRPPKGGREGVSVFGAGKEVLASMVRAPVYYAGREENGPFPGERSRPGKRDEVRTCESGVGRRLTTRRARRTYARLAREKHPTDKIPARRFRGKRRDGRVQPLGLRCENPPLSSREECLFRAPARHAGGRTK